MVRRREKFSERMEEQIRLSNVVAQGKAIDESDARPIAMIGAFEVIGPVRVVDPSPLATMAREIFIHRVRFVAGGEGREERVAGLAVECMEDARIFEIEFQKMMAKERKQIEEEREANAKETAEALDKQRHESVSEGGIVIPGSAAPEAATENRKSDGSATP